ncbi:MAG: 23S rRNA (pseudouridine(1915)-N(3))-methyltransferase RlmH [Bacteroidales bacterium]|nr:23S rRNA (pseudouridine(1915)-N(3))-methyltransferase RlmH [Bacteroidales bacterium]
MRLRLIVVGKTVEDWLRTAVALYGGRISHYAPFTVVEIPELKNVASLTREQIKEREGELILRQLHQGEHVTLLDERGAKFTSIEWARHLEKEMSRSGADRCFVVGGSYGFSPKVYERADALLSLSPMTMSHQLVRAVFTEQLYRAFTIMRSEPYHHE